MMILVSDSLKIVSSSGLYRVRIC